MSRRTQIFSQIPWNGGINDSVDPGFLPPNDLVAADNVVFGTSGSRLKRQGHEYLDSLSDVPTILKRSSSGTTRTIQFSAGVKTTAPTNHKLVAGESVTISTSASGTEATKYAGTFKIATVATTTITNDTITYVGGSSLSESATATSTLSAARADTYLSIVDFWRDTGATNTKTRELIAIGKVTSDANYGLNLFTHDDSGRRIQIAPLSAGTDDDFTASATNQIVTTVMNEKLIMAFDGLGNLPRVYDPNNAATYKLLPGTPPDFSLMAQHQSRLWTNDKANKDRLNYSPPGDPETWNGIGDSGALDIQPGDGDPIGIISIFKPFKGILFVAKKTKLYQVAGTTPEDYQVLEVTSGIGASGPLSQTSVDQDDLYYGSDKGFHTLKATNAYGDFSADFLSASIQNTFKTFATGKLRYTQAVYLPSLNSVAFSITEQGQTEVSALWLFNVKTQGWYRWPGIDAQSIAVKRDNASTRLIYGTSDSRLVGTERGTWTDFDATPIHYRIKTGRIYPNNDPLSVKAFKGITFYFKPKGNFSFTVNVKIDNYSTQSLAFNQTVAGALLGTTFTLGQSVLGFDDVLAPYTQPIDGIGRGATIEITQGGLDEQVEIYGFSLIYEQVDQIQESASSSEN